MNSQEETGQVEFRVTTARRRGKKTDLVEVYCTGELVHQDCISGESASKRRTFCRQLAKKLDEQDDSEEEVDVDSLEQELMRTLHDAHQESQVTYDYRTILQAVGLQVIAEEGGGAAHVVSSITQKPRRIDRIASLRFEDAIQLVGSPESLSRGETVGAIIGIADLKAALAEAAAKAPRYESLCRRGQGVWERGAGLDDGVLVVDGNAAYRFADGKLTELTEVVIGNLLIERDASKRWHGNLPGRLSAMTENQSWATFQKIRRTVDRWNWQHARDSVVLVSLLAATFVQRLLNWRPNVTIIGPSNSGKSTLFGEVLKPILGPGANYVDRSTEAGIRQLIGDSAMPILLDEFDASRGRQQTRELMRSASRGGHELRGTSEQQAISQEIRHVFFVAGTESGDHYEQDSNRIVRLELGPPSQPGDLTLPNDGELKKLSAGFAVAALWASDTAVQLAVEVRSTRVAGISSRLVESYAVPAAFYAVLKHGLDVELNKVRQILRWMLNGRQESLVGEQSEAEAVLDEILTASLQGSKFQASSTVGQAIDTVTANGCTDVGEAAESLLAAGIRLVQLRDGQNVLFFDHRTIRTKLLKGGRFSESNVDQLLLRLADAYRDQQRMGGDRRPNGISIRWPRQGVGGAPARQASEEGSQASTALPSCETPQPANTVVTCVSRTRRRQPPPI